MSIYWSLSLLGFAASPAVAFWRLPCTAPLVVERADPIINPGEVSGHLHQILGGNGFGFAMTYNDTQKSTCSSCTVKGDFSNYWTPNLWYKSENGSFSSVAQTGGATVYYLQRNGDTNNALLAFPEGFRMVAGDPYKRAPGTDFASQAVSYACLNYNAAATPETPGFPTTDCPDGLRAQIFFPSCWDGVNLDSSDHKSHMAYPIQNYNDGTCPDTHPVQLVSIFYEVTFSITDFANQWYDGWPFVWSMGDPTGYGFHGDFVNGWDVDLLQSAVNDCTNLSGRVEDCPHFDLTPDNIAQGCTIEPQVNEVTSGTLDALPGCNPVQAGPNEATPQTGCGATKNISTAGSYFTDLTSIGWAYVGCGTDNYFDRILTGASTSNQNMTNSNCANFCSSKGFSVAGSEYSDECYCGDSIPSAGEPVAGVVGNCKMPCAGDSTESCGGSAAISLYQKCTGSSCVNAAVGVVNPGSGLSSAVATPPTTSVSTTGNSTTSAASTHPSSQSVTLSSGSMQTTMATVQVTSSLAISSATPTMQQGSSSTTGGSASTASGIGVPSGWSYTGCYTDTVQPRSLPIWSTFNGPQMSNAACINFCSGQGYSFAGTEYAGQCFCGSTINSTMLSDTSCDTPCTGAAGEMCGGAAALSVWTTKSSRSMIRRSLR